MVTTPFPSRISPLNNITPFTYQDGVTYLEVLEKIRVYINDSLRPEFDEELARIIGEFNTGIGNAEQTITDLEASWQLSWDAFMANVEAEIALLNDGAVASMVEDVTSQTRQILETLYENKVNLPVSVNEYADLVVGTDWTPAFQAAVDTSRNVTVPAGTYQVTNLRINNSGQKLLGASRDGTTLFSSTDNIINFHATAHVTFPEIAHLRMESRLGGGHIMNVPFGINQGVLHELDLVQRNDTKSILFCDRSNAVNGGLFDMNITDIRGGMPDTSTVPGINIVGGGNVYSANLINRCRIERGGTYLIHIESGLISQTYSYGNTFCNLNFEVANHGGMKLLGALNNTLDNVGFFDNNVIDTDIIHIGTSRGNIRSRGINIRGLLRTGGTLLAGVVDVRLETPFGPGNSFSGISAPAPAGMILDIGTTDTILSGIDNTVTVLTTQSTASIAGSITLSGTTIITGATEPEGAVSAPLGAVYLCTAVAATGRFFYKETNPGENTGWRSASQPAVQPSLNLDTAAYAINTKSKSQGRPVYNSTTNRVVWATGSAPTSTWVYADGLTAHTPA